MRMQCAWARIGFLTAALASMHNKLVGRPKRKSEAEQYLAYYQDLLRWINTCVTCGARGHRPEMPESIYPWFNLAAENLRRFFSPLELDALGRCPECQRALGIAPGGK